MTRKPVEEIRTLFGGRSPLVGPAAEERVRECCSLLHGRTHHKEKIADIQAWAKTYFSERKWQKHPGVRSTIAGWVRSACDLIESDLRGKRHGKRN